ncbi:hypothetical protein Tco_1391302 [Tanacetum coccineum]
MATFQSDSLHKPIIFANLIISEVKLYQEFTDEIGELRAISSHVLRATRVQIPEDDLDNVHSLREVDGILVFVDPRDLLGSCLLADIGFITLVLLTDSVFLFFLGFLEYTKLTTGLGDSDSRTIGFLEGTSLVVVILVKGHAFPTIVKVRPVGLQIYPILVNTFPVGF